MRDHCRTSFREVHQWPTRRCQEWRYRKSYAVAGRPAATHRLRDGAVERNISEQEIREAGSQAITIEEYPDDKYGPTRLLLGFTGVGRPLHIQVADSPSPTVDG